MNEHTAHHERFEALLAECTDGGLDAAQSAELATVLKSDAVARRRYVRYMMTDALLESELHVEPAVLDTGAMGTGAGSDAFACTVAEGGAGDEPFPIARPTRLAEPQQGWRRWIGYAAMAAVVTITAAVTVMLLGTTLDSGAVDGGVEPVVVHEHAGAPIAIVTDLSSAEWDTDADRLMPEIGTQMARGSLRLKAGTAQLMFNSGAVVDVIGPAEFDLNGESGGRLTRGKLLVWVPPRAHGFTIDTPGMRVVDLGTQFGVQVLDDGRVEVHVLQGAVETYATDNADKPVRLEQEQALRFNPVDGSIELAGIERVRFNRRPVVNGGVTVVDLLDVVAGGDGSGEATTRGLHPHTAELAEKWYHDYDTRGTSGYRPVRWNPVIDGVFVPSGADGDVMLNSNGDTFDGFPVTDRKFISPIWAHRPRLDVGSRPIDFRSLPQEKRNWVREAGTANRYNPEQRGMLALHANAGITFDLDVVRRLHPVKRLVRFHATTGNIQGPGGGRHSPQLADVWVFVDGELRFSRTRINATHGTFEVDIELTPHDRFLTLVATDSSNGYNNDQIVFGDPVIELAPR